MGRWRGGGRVEDGGLREETNGLEGRFSGPLRTEVGVLVEASRIRTLFGRLAGWAIEDSLEAKPGANDAGAG